MTCTAAEASPYETLLEKTTPLAKSAVVTTSSTDAPTKATANVANLAADTCFAAALASTYATMDPTQEAQATNLVTKEKPEANRDKSERITEPHRKQTQLDKPQENPHNRKLTILAAL